MLAAKAARTDNHRGEQRYANMNRDHQILIKKIILSNAFAALPLTLMAAIIWDIPTGMSLFLGSFMATAGFIGNVWLARFILEGYAGAWLAVVIQVFKVLSTLVVGIVLIRIRPGMILFYLAGYSVIFFGIFVYTRHINKKGE